MRHTRLAVHPILPLLALLAGCASARPVPAPACPGCDATGGTPAPAPQAPAQLAYEPQQIVVTPVDLELAGKNDEELFAVGQAAFAAKDFARAAAAFDRLVDLRP